MATAARKTAPARKTATAARKPAASRKTTATTQAEPVRKRVYRRRSAPTITVPRVATVPDMSTYKAYMDREWPGGHSTFDIYDTAMANNWNVLNKGPTGCGKTMSVEAWCAKNRLHYYAIPNNRSMDVGEIVGQWVPDANGDKVAVFRDGGMTDVFRHGGAILANEFTFLPDGIMSFLYQALGRERQVTLLSNGGEVVKAAENVLIVADYNPGYQAVRELNAAVANRFQIQLTWDYDTDVEANLVQSDALLDLARRMRSDAASGQYDTPISTNMLMEFEDNVYALSYEFAAYAFTMHFAEHERMSVTTVLSAMEANLRKSVAKGSKGSTIELDENDAWGEYGKDWRWSDEEFADEEDGQ